MTTSHPKYPVLYSFRRCPYAIRARMTLRYAGITCELREIDLKNKASEFVTLSPKATVPVLQTRTGAVLEQSLDIMLWALQQSDPDDWLESHDNKAKKLLHENDNEFKPELDRYKYFQRFPHHPQAHYRELACLFLEKLEQRLIDNDDHLSNNEAGLADIAIFPFIRQFAHTDYGWFSKSRFQRLIHWLKEFETSELFLSVMQKHKPWRAGDPVSLTI